MGGWTGVGKDRIHWKGQIEQTELVPHKNNDLVTKQYVDNQPLDATITLYLSDDASDIGTYYDLKPVPTGEAESSVGVVAAANDTLIKPFASILNCGCVSGLDVLTEGVYESHLHAESTKTGCNIYAKLYKRNAGGTETLLSTSETTDNLSVGSSSSYVIHFTITDDITWTATDRVVVKYYANPGTGANPTVTMYMEGNTASRVTIKTTAFSRIHGQLAGLAYADAGHTGFASTAHTHEGTAILSTGEGGASKFLREDGDDTCSWQTVSAGLWEVDGTETQLITGDAIDMQTNKIINLVDPTADQEAATKKYVDDNDTTYTAGDGMDLAAGVFSTDLKANGGLVIDATEVTVDLGASSITGTLAVGDGGTGATTKAGAMDALSPGAVKGDLIVHNGTTNLKHPIGTNGDALVADSTSATGLNWKNYDIWEQWGFWQLGRLDANNTINLGVTGNLGGGAVTGNVGSGVDTSGCFITYSTAGGPGPGANVGYITSTFADSANKHKYNARFKLRNTNDTRFFIGLTDQAAGVMVGADAPGGHYIGIHYSSVRGDANFQWAEGNAGGQTLTSTTQGIDTAPHEIWVTMDSASSFTAKFFNAGGTLVSTSTLTTNLPATTNIMAHVHEIDDTGPGGPKLFDFYKAAHAERTWEQ